jgi:hypothetical protein
MTTAKQAATGEALEQSLVGRQRCKEREGLHRWRHDALETPLDRLTEWRACGLDTGAPIS